MNNYITQHQELLETLKQKKKWVWKETLKLHKRSKETRIASSLSAIEIFVALYYGKIIKQNPCNPHDDTRDRCIISKGHGSLAMYSILADLGFFPLSELDNMCKENSFLGGIPDPVIPGYETINGSLGHGVGVGAGIALALKARQKPECVYVITGDGELHEGANWEAFMFAAQHKLNNLIVLVDNNGISMLDRTENIISHGCLASKFRAFGWMTFEVKNGHDIYKVHESLLQVKSLSVDCPKVIIFYTKKGYRVPGMEDQPLSHIMDIKTDMIDQLISGSDYE